MIIKHFEDIYKNGAASSNIQVTKIRKFIFENGPNFSKFL